MEQLHEMQIQELDLSKLLKLIDLHCPKSTEVIHYICILELMFYKKRLVLTQSCLPETKLKTINRFNKYNMNSPIL